MKVDSSGQVDFCLRFILLLIVCMWGLGEGFASINADVPGCWSDQLVLELRPVYKLPDMGSGSRTLVLWKSMGPSL